ncbi:MAG: aminoacyl-tRNA hydrolase [Chromatiales bacterium]|nr:MAG: aminoacyl-tRNA hydrolase [Chromatiales bacterium]
MNTQPPQLIVGLGNPGAEHAKDRHNVGYWLADELAAGAGGSFRSDGKLLGEACQVQLGHAPVRLLKPTTYMNRSGGSVRRAIDYYKLDIERVLVIHDEIDLPAGVARLKQGGGHGGHNGLRDITQHCGRDFMRLRIGVGHPGTKEQVTGHVLKAPGRDELELIHRAIDESRRALDVLFAHGWDRATAALHTATPRPE